MASNIMASVSRKAAVNPVSEMLIKQDTHVRAESSRLRDKNVPMRGT